MIPVALAGSGRWGRNLGRALQRLPDFELRATADPRAGGMGVPHYADLRSLLAEQHCDAVFIATPPQLHASLVEQALAAGKHVFVEKPMCSSSAEAARIRAANALAATRLMVGHLLVYDPAVRALLRRFQGALEGASVRVAAKRWSAADGRGDRCPWWTLAPHDLSLLLRLLSAPTRLRVFPAAAGELVAQLEFTGGSRAELSYCTQAPQKVRLFEVVSAGVRWVLDDLATHRLVEHRGARLRPIVVGCEAPLDEELRHFAWALRAGAAFDTGVEEGSAIVELLECGQRSLSAGGAWVSWPAAVAAGQC